MQVPGETKNCSVQIRMNPVVFDRMEEGVNAFAQRKLSKFLTNTILGLETASASDERSSWQMDIQRLLPFGKRHVNSAQTKAIITALQNELTLIEGPPGTGKTFTAAALSHAMLQYYHDFKQRRVKILACAPGNVVVDKLADTLYDFGLNVTRFVSYQYEKSSKCRKEVKLTYKMWEEFRQLREDDENVKYDACLERYVLDNSDIVCCTCSAAKDARLSHLNFDVVIVDEASFATEPMCLQTFSDGAEKVILIGDTKQLGPVVKCREAELSGLGTSLFDRLLELGYPVQSLNVQFRMSPTLCHFPNSFFYKSRLLNAVYKDDKRLSQLFCLPTGVDQTCFFHCDGKEYAHTNIAEAEAVFRLIRYLIHHQGMKEEQVGVITYYRAQQYLLYTKLSINYPKVEVKCVDGFQGSEKDVIIVSCVRTKSIGFTNNPRRMNVMLTRARCGLFIFGNVDFLKEVT
eukprot:TRINITY_DN12173_c0_g1_i2.p1 TRINITY_DN12173_c0_g1~~TRINITY_DN12173_c0_g1_i2.p1  ORF type:complete len:460 (-),score=76.34 TRINITY_DN12173_c0_g1_i2:283-1662(-)